MSLPVPAMRPLVLLLALTASGCASVYSVPPSLYAPAPPVVPLHDGPGDLTLSGGVGVRGASGAATFSPAPHVGVYVRGTRARAPEVAPADRDLLTVEQTEAEVGLTLYGPTRGVLRTELGLGAAQGRVAGYGADSVATCMFCGATNNTVSTPYRAEGRTARRSGRVTVAVSADPVAMGVTAGLAHVRVSDVEREGGGRLPNASEVFAEFGTFLRGRVGPVSVGALVGTSRPVRAEHREPDAFGVRRTLGGRYRTVPGYAAITVGLDLHRLGGGDS